MPVTNTLAYFIPLCVTMKNVAQYKHLFFSHSTKVVQLVLIKKLVDKKHSSLFKSPDSSLFSAVPDKNEAVGGGQKREEHP